LGWHTIRFGKGADGYKNKSLVAPWNGKLAEFLREVKPRNLWAGYGGDSSEVKMSHRKQAGVKNAVGF
jgi:hypothetical protein